MVGGAVAPLRGGFCSPGWSQYADAAVHRQQKKLALTLEIPLCALM